MADKQSHQRHVPDHYLQFNNDDYSLELARFMKTESQKAGPSF